MKRNEYYLCVLLSQILLVVCLAIADSRLIPYLFSREDIGL